MSVGDSAEELMLVHVIGRERLPALSCGLPSNPLKIVKYSACPLGDDRERFRPLFSAHQSPNVFSTEAWSGRATYHRPKCGHCTPKMDRSPQRARHVHSFTTLLWILSNEVCGTRPFESKICLRISQADVAQDCRQNSTFPGKLES